MALTTLRPYSHEAVLARADAEDQNNKRVYGNLKKHTLSWLPGDLQQYRTMLPQLCALRPAAEPLSTIPTHPDLLEANIFVDNANTLVALVDWERARLEPTTLFGFIPKFLDEDGGPDTFYVPSRTNVPEAVKASHVYDYDKLALARRMYESTYQALMGRSQGTGLRRVYQDEGVRCTIRQAWQHA